MNIKILPLFVISTLLFVRCDGGRDSREITVTRNLQQTVSIDDLFDKYRFVYLETNDSALVGVPQKILRDGERLFISDGKALFQFSIQGKLLNMLHREGRGPGEYRAISDFVLTRDGIIILDMSQKNMIKYDFSGNSTDTYPLEMFVASIESLDAGKILLHSANQRESGDKFLIYDINTKRITDSFWPVPDSHNTYRHFMGQKNFYRYNNMLLFNEPMNSTVYRIEAGMASPYLTLNLFDRNPPENIWNNEYTDVTDIRSRLNEAGYSYGTPMYAESDDRILFSYNHPDGYRMCLYDKTTGTSVQFDSIAVSSDGKVAVNFTGANVTASDPDNFIFSITGDNFFNERDELLSDEFSAATLWGNPVICIASLP